MIIYMHVCSGSVMQVVIHYYDHVLIMCFGSHVVYRGYSVMFGFHVVYRGCCKSRGLIVIVLIL